MPKNPPWNSEEDKLLTDNVSLTIKELVNIIGRSEGAIRNRKTILGIKSNKFPIFTDYEKDIINQWYSNNEGVDLDGLSIFLNRPKTSISKIARDMGLTKYGNYTKEELYKRAESIVNNTKYSNPSRFKGHSHSKNSRDLISANLKITQSNIPAHIKKERARKAIQTKRIKGIFNTTSNAYSRCVGGFRNDLNKYFRSSWEANIVRLFNHLHIQWFYETKRFDFYNETNGVLSYQPDFYLPEYDLWIEVKGWMDENSIKRLELFSEYYPIESDKLLVIDSKLYYKIEQIYKDMITNWEYKGRFLKSKMLYNTKK